MRAGILKTSFNPLNPKSLKYFRSLGPIFLTLAFKSKNTYA